MLQYIVATETSVDMLLQLAKKDANVNEYFARVRRACLLRGSLPPPPGSAPAPAAGPGAVLVLPELVGVSRGWLCLRWC